MKKLLPIAAFAMFAAILVPIPAHADPIHALKSDTVNSYPKLIIYQPRHPVEAGKELYLLVGYDTGTDTIRIESDTLMVESDGYYWPLSFSVYEVTKGKGLEIFDQKTPTYDEAAKGHPINAEKLFHFVLKPTSKLKKIEQENQKVIVRLRDPKTGKTGEVPVLVVKTAK